MVTAGHRRSVSIVLRVVRDVARFVAAMCRSRSALAAENLLLKKQIGAVHRAPGEVQAC
jgi:hypothetical protein